MPRINTFDHRLVVPRIHSPIALRCLHATKHRGWREQIAWVRPSRTCQLTLHLRGESRLRHPMNPEIITPKLS